MENMAIWTAVSSTDPKFTSRVQQRGGFTSIDAYFQIRQATELWGPYGFRWGLRNLRRTLEKDLEMAILDAEFFYPVGNETVSFEIGNSLFFVLKSKSGDKPDDEFIKKLETNTISKALSRLGFGADVFLGMFDDNRYIEEQNLKYGNPAPTAPVPFAPAAPAAPAVRPAIASALPPPPPPKR